MMNLHGFIFITIMSIVFTEKLLKYSRLLVFFKETPFPPFFFCLVVDYVMRVSVDKIQENGFLLEQRRGPHRLVNNRSLSLIFLHFLTRYITCRRSSAVWPGIFTTFSLDISQTSTTSKLVYGPSNPPIYLTDTDFADDITLISSRIDNAQSL